MASMRDSIQLSTNIWLPMAEGQYPAIVIRSPYCNDQSDYDRLNLQAYIDNGFAVIFQMVRGLGNSEGKFRLFFNEAQDGYDCIEWVAEQDWCNGKVGMDGGSYLGTVQWLAARERPPHLVCIAPSVPAGDYFNEIPYSGGALNIDWAFTWLSAFEGIEFDFEEQGHTNLEAFRPLISASEKVGADLSILNDILDHQTLDDYWKRIQFSPDDFAKIDIPVFTVTGWFDGDQAGSLFYWHGIEQRSNRKQDRFLTIGPWMHADCYLGGQERLHEMEFGVQSILPIQQLRINFFNACLKGESEKLADRSRVQVFITGKNEWLKGDQYPPQNIARKKLFLHSNGSANLSNGAGKLTWLAPYEEPTDQFEYDPVNPVPYKMGAMDHHDIEQRPDVLVYSSDILDEELTIIGQPELVLFAASDGLDTDFTAKILDVYPDERVVSLTHMQGILRARYRNGMEKTELLTSGKPEEFKIRLAHIGHCFLPGHKIRLEVSSSCFPLIDPNSNTGHNFATDTEVRIARQTVFHDGERPSHLLLPIFFD